MQTNTTNSLQTNIISMFAAAILAAVIAVAVASVLIANRIDAVTQNQQPTAQLAHAVTETASAPAQAIAASCEVPAGDDQTGAVLSAATTGHVVHKPAGHTHSHTSSNTHTNTNTTNTTTNGNTGNTGNSGFVNVPVNVSGNSILNDNLNGNHVLNNNDILSENEVNVLNGNTTEVLVPVLNLVGNQVGPTGILASLL